jgi:hypothetical protein
MTLPGSTWKPLTDEDRKSRLDAAFDIVCTAAAAGHRCPQNGEHGLASGALPELARAGRIKIYIYPHNYRVILILEGPHRGCRTADAPTGRHPWKLIDKNGTRVNGALKTPASRSIPSLAKITAFD